MTCPWFGVAGVVRPGEWAGLRLSVKDSADKPREVLVRIALQDPDGDHALWEGKITTNPGVALPLWQYVYLPTYFKSADVLTVNCFAAVEEAGKGTGQGGFGAGRLLGTSRIAPRFVTSRPDGMLAIAGSRPLGLGKYQGAADRSDLPTGHEKTQVMMQLTPDLFPDRWQGLRQFDVIVWNEPPPGGLGTEKAQAIREWVQRGGHLVVVLPRVGQAWTDEANNPLFDITPKVVVDRHEGVDLSPYRMLITKSRPMNLDGTPGLAMPASEVVQTFRPMEGVLPGEATCILAGIEREAGKGPEWLVVRRTVGAGMVDLVGLDVGSRWMTEHGLPDSECFWHRILGRRGELWTQAEYATHQQRGNLNYRDAPITVDRDIGPDIAMSGSAMAGVLMGLVVFALYWLIAGPLGFAVLKKTNRARHAWVAFVAAAGFFTALAWGGATVVRPAQLKAQHLSFLDHVYSASLGSSVERCRSWVSLLIPQYGEATVSVGDPATKSASPSHNLLAPWDADATPGGGFPDARGYRIEGKSPDQYTVPTRSTVKQFMVDWAGGSKLKMIRPLPIDGKDGPSEIRLVEQDGKESLHGILTHDLPGPLLDVVIVLVKGQIDIQPWWFGQSIKPVLARGSAYALNKPWDPNEPVDLSVDFTPRAKQAGGPDITDLAAYMRTVGEGLGRSDQGDGMGVTGGSVWGRLLGATFYPLLDPPDMTEDRTVGMKAQKLVQRRFAHGLDMAQWFTQPCVIVIGHLDPKTAGACPAPLFVNTGGGFREVKTEGWTVVRWVYPLPANPPGFSAAPPPPTDDRLPAEREGDADEKSSTTAPIRPKKGKPL